eukprot:6157882-Heterocapsa_arctica.AAC.1
MPKAMWFQLLSPFQGNLPTTEDEFQFLVGYLRRQGHLLEPGGVTGIGLQGRHDSHNSGHPAGHKTYMTGGCGGCGSD